MRSFSLKKLYRHRPQIAFPKNKLRRRGGSGSQERPRVEIMKGDKLGREGGSSSQEQDKVGGRQMKGDKAAAAAKSSPEWRS